MGYYQEVSVPPRYIKLTPTIFSLWLDWAKGYKAPEADNTIRPMGKKISPEWVRWKFKDDLEDFFQYYNKLTGD